MASIIETLSTEFSSVKSVLSVANIRKKNVEPRNRLRIAQEYSKYASSLLHLADFAAEATGAKHPPECELEEAASIDRTQIDIVDAVEAALEGVLQAVKAKLDANMQSSLEIADILSAVLDLKRRVRIAPDYADKKMESAKTAIRRLNLGIDSVDVALVSIVVGTSGFALWGATMVFPALLIPSLVATGVQYWHLGETYSRVNEVKRLATECEAFQSQISKAEREIAEHARLSTALTMEIETMESLISSAESFVNNLEACNATSQSTERRYSEEQTLAIDLVMQT
ncbi:hypothetical protein BKA65DRAFT_545296 [Rhexocercosporidium sp. MPI-PUGE-AT-0058]|nr:hypothetical protein BKA65DRAFT_545296 [Rhexocercosporidium sp. MPI-PUGE-AT-0058]